MEKIEASLKNTFGNDFSEDYLARIERFPGIKELPSNNPDFNLHPAFLESSEKMDFLIDERVISFFKVAENHKDMALVLYNFSDEEVEVRWSPEFACDNIREILQEELISLEEDELVFLVKPQQLQWICFEKTDSLLSVIFTGLL